MFAKLAIVVNVLVYVVDLYIYILVYVVCGVVFRVVCCVVPLYIYRQVSQKLPTFALLWFCLKFLC
jgi:hypothetical protein